MKKASLGRPPGGVRCRQAPCCAGCSGLVSRGASLSTDPFTWAACGGLGSAGGAGPEHRQPPARTDHCFRGERETSHGLEGIDLQPPGEKQVGSWERWGSRWGGPWIKGFAWESEKPAHHVCLLWALAPTAHEGTRESTRRRAGVTRHPPTRRAGADGPSLRVRRGTKAWTVRGRRSRPERGPLPDSAAFLGRKVSQQVPASPHLRPCFKQVGLRGRRRPRP